MFTTIFHKGNFYVNFDVPMFYVYELLFITVLTYYKILVYLS